MTKLFVIAQAILSAVRVRVDSSDLILLAGAGMCALGLAWYSIPMAFIVVGGAMVGFALYSAMK